jgi:hypothetical protein
VRVTVGDVVVAAVVLPPQAPANSSTATSGMSRAATSG